jgi:hypothetical protein
LITDPPPDLAISGMALDPPALLTRTSSRPYSLMVNRTALSTDASSVTSRRWYTARPPAEVMACATASPSRRRPPTTTLAPSAANITGRTTLIAA